MKIVSRGHFSQKSSIEMLDKVHNTPLLKKETFNEDIRCFKGLFLFSVLNKRK